MLIPLYHLCQKYNINFKGILHVGAHECEELADYERYITRDKILWIDAIPEKVELCKQRFSNLNIENAVVSDNIETVEFKVANNGQSSSMLDFGSHSQYYPQITYINTFSCETKMLKDIIPKYSIHFNFLNLDIQGAELKALIGMGDYLHNVDYIYTEVNSSQVYKDCALVTDIDDYLKQFGLVRVETSWTGCQWGDAFYIRN
jgi:FkbM family methyltransferase